MIVFSASGQLSSNLLNAFFQPKDGTGASYRGLAGVHVQGTFNSLTEGPLLLSKNPFVVSRPLHPSAVVIESQPSTDNAGGADGTDRVSTPGPLTLRP